MPAVHRKGDIGSGHDGYAPRANDQGSPTVFVNGKAAHRQTDNWPLHCNPIPVCHTSTLATGSRTVFADNLQLARVGDPVACGSTCVGGSTTVFAGG